MFKNKLKLFGIAMMLMTLASCSSISATPSNQDDPLVNQNDGSELDVDNNNYGVVYEDLIDNGTVNSTVFNDLMYRIAENKLTSYYEGENALFTEEEFNAEVNNLINEKLYDYISSGTYLTNNHFDESKLVISLKQSLYQIEPGTYSDGTEATYNQDTVVFTPETRAAALEDGHLGGDGTVDDDDILHYDYTDYKERVLKREVYTQLLVAKYLEDESYASLGRAYSRKVSYIAVEKNAAHPDAAKNTIDAFVNVFVGNEDEIDLNNLAKLWKGVDYSNPDGSLPADLQTIINDYSLRTLADDIIDDFKKVVVWDNEHDTYATDANGNSIALPADLVDSTLESTFTGNYSHLPEVGKEEKDIELAQKSLVTEGWYIKNGGLTDLPDAIRSRLFDIRTANDFQAIKNGSTSDDDLSGFVRNINGTNFLVPAQTQTTISNSDIIMYDRDSETYYIVIVEDALNASSLSITDTALERVISEKHPDVTDPDEIAEYIAEEKQSRLLNAHEVAKMLATRSSNQTEATIFYLKEANIVFHDEDIYNYFKENYGDMFEEDD